MSRPDEAAWMNDLAGVYAKLHRARVHSDELGRAEAEFRLRSPWTVAETMEDDWHMFRAVITRPAPLSLSVIMGEAIHQMRSSLDHLATAATRLCDPTASEVHFPLSQRSAVFDKWKKAHGSHMRADHMDVIERHQPFATKAELHELLRAMADFDNEAKHAVVPPAYAFMSVAGFMGDAEVEFLSPESIENGTALCRCRPAPGARRSRYRTRLWRSARPDPTLDPHGHAVSGWHDRRRCSRRHSRVERRTCAAGHAHVT